MTDAHDEIPSDDQVLAIVRETQGGATPSVLLDALCEQGYPAEDVIEAIQRAFDRGLLELGDELTLVEAPERQLVAA